ncbi:MAG: hypothetical protein FWG44_00625 [Oscillospiraceae bacterium]|nr:hypothetical protein [Oscillospiraceae bacterium]
MRTESEDVLLSISTEENPLDGLSDVEVDSFTAIIIDYSVIIVLPFTPFTTLYNKQLHIRVGGKQDINIIKWKAVIMNKRILILVLFISLLILSSCILTKNINNEILPPPNELYAMIFVDNELYHFFDFDKGGRMNKEELEYLGNIIKTQDRRVPDENFVSNCYSSDTEIYRVDENCIYIEYQFAFQDSIWSGFGYNTWERAVNEPPKKKTN